MEEVKIRELLRETKSGKKHCGLRTKALIQGLGTRLECRHISLCNN